MGFNGIFVGFNGILWDLMGFNGIFMGFLWDLPSGKPTINY